MSFVLFTFCNVLLCTPTITFPQKITLIFSDSPFLANISPVFRLSRQKLLGKSSIAARVKREGGELRDGEVRGEDEGGGVGGGSLVDWTELRATFRREASKPAATR